MHLAVNQRQRGFTLVELVITIIIIGIMSATVMVQISGRTQHSVTVQADQLRRDLSHIQLLAISRSAHLRLTVDSTGASYSVVSCSTSSCSSSIALIDPATGQTFSTTLTDGVKLAPFGTTFDFDSLGRPASGSSLISSSPAKTFTLSASSRSVTVTVNPITGFAQTSY